jgi:hypothetical protein
MTYRDQVEMNLSGRPRTTSHRNGVQVVGGSNPLGPTSRKPSSYLEEGFFVAFGLPHLAVLVVTLVVTGTSGSTLESGALSL